MLHHYNFFHNYIFDLYMVKPVKLWSPELSGQLCMMATITRQAMAYQWLHINHVSVLPKTCNLYNSSYKSSAKHSCIISTYLDVTVLLESLDLTALLEFDSATT